MYGGVGPNGNTPVAGYNTSSGVMLGNYSNGSANMVPVSNNGMSAKQKVEMAIQKARWMYANNQIYSTEDYVAHPSLIPSFHYTMFNNADEAKNFIDSSISRKEKFFYALDDGRFIVGPWQDAINDPANNKVYVSEQYSNFQYNGKLYFDDNVFSIDFFGHSHPPKTNREVSKADGRVYDYFQGHNHVPTTIYYEGIFWLHNKDKVTGIIP